MILFISDYVKDECSPESIQERFYYKTTSPDTPLYASSTYRNFYTDVYE